MELEDRSHSGKIDPFLSLSSQNKIMQEVSLKSTYAMILLTLDAGISP